MIDDLKKFIPENAYSDKEIKEIITLVANPDKDMLYEDKESLVSVPSPVLAKTETYGNENEKVIIIRLKNESDIYVLLSSFVPRFNQKGSVYPFSFIGSYIKDIFVSTGTNSFARFGEKQEFDTFLNCTKNRANTFPRSFINRISQGAIIKLSDSYSYRGFLYLIGSYLDSLGNIHFGLTSNTGGSTENFQLEGKSSYQQESGKTDVVFSLNEGTTISSGLYRYRGSGFRKSGVDGAGYLGEQRSPYMTRWKNNIEVQASERYLPGPNYYQIMMDIFNGKKGFISFWLDLSNYGGYGLGMRISIEDIPTRDGIRVDIDGDYVQDTITSDILFSGINWSKYHRLTFRWDFTSFVGITAADHLTDYVTIQVDDLVPKHVAIGGGGAIFNSFGVIRLEQLGSNGMNYDIFGITQDGDWFPFVYPESNKQFYNLHNINLMEYLDGVTGPFRDDEVGFKNLYSTSDGYDEFDASKEPLISYPDSDILNMCYLQQGTQFTAGKGYVEFTDAAGNGFGLRLLSSDYTYNGRVFSYLTTTTTAYYIDQVIAFVSASRLTYRNEFIPSYDLPNFMLPTSLGNQVHPKYPDVVIINSWYGRYFYAFSTGSLITKVDYMRNDVQAYPNVSDLEFAPLTHPFCHPNNISFRPSSNNAMIDRFEKSQRRLRKEVFIIEELFSEFEEGDDIFTSPRWTAAGVPIFTAIKEDKYTVGPTTYKVYGSTWGKFEDGDALNTASATYQFPADSPTVPGYYTIEFDFIQTGNSNTHYIRILDTGAAVNISILFTTATGAITCDGVAATVTFNPDQNHHFKIIVNTPTQYSIEIDGVLDDNAGGFFVPAIGFVNPIRYIQIDSTPIANLAYVYIDNIESGWKLYPNVDDDDYIIYPSYLGHARPIEVVGLLDPWGFRDYGKYTAVPTSHPGRFWVSWYMAMQWGYTEGWGEIIFYDVAGNEMFYIKVEPYRTTKQDINGFLLKYASDSAETTTGLTSLGGPIAGWLPITVEIDIDDQKASVYYHCEKIADDIDLNPSIEELGEVVFMAGQLTLPAQGNKLWREEDFQWAAEGTAIATSGNWAFVTGGGVTFVATSINGDMWAFMDDTSAVNSGTGTFTFPFPSTGTPGAYAVKFECILPRVNDRCYFALKEGANIRISCYTDQAGGGSIYTNTGAGFVLVANGLFGTGDITEVIIVTVNNATHYFVVNGVVYNNGGANYANFAVWTGAISDMDFITTAAQQYQFLIDNIDASWTEAATESDYPIRGSFMIDGIQWSCKDDDFKQFKEYRRCDFLKMYRDYEQPHISTFHNCINWPDEDIIPLPPYDSAPSSSYNHASNTGVYWTFTSPENAGMYAGIIRNWFIWRYPFVFGGQFDQSVDTNLRSMMRLEHTVSAGDKQTSGIWEFYIGGLVDEVSGAGGDGEIVVTFDYTNGSANYRLDTIQSTNYMIRIINDGGIYNVYIMDDALPRARFVNSKELHLYKVVWSVGYVRTYIDERLIDERKYNIGSSFYFADFKIHAAVTDNDSRLYAIVFGAQCSNEDNYREGILDMIPGGTIENEGATGHKISRNGGTYFLENQKDDWRWENAHFWKTLTLDQSNEIDYDNFKELQQNLIEYGKSGANWYTLLHNNVNKYYLLHSSGQVGSTNTDMETYGKFFSLFINNFDDKYLTTIFKVFDVFIFTNGYVTTRQIIDVIGLEGSLSKLLGIYAAQLSQSNDISREIYYNTFDKYKRGYTLKEKLKTLQIPFDFSISDENIRVILEEVVKIIRPTTDNLLDYLSVIYDRDRKYIQIEETPEGIIDISLDYPQGIITLYTWRDVLINLIECFRCAGIEYTYTYRACGISENSTITDDGWFV